MIIYNNKERTYKVIVRALHEGCFALATAQVAREQLDGKGGDDLAKMVIGKMVASGLLTPMENLANEVFDWMNIVEINAIVEAWNKIPDEKETDEYIHRMSQKRYTLTGELYSQFGQKMINGRAYRANSLFHSAKFNRTHDVLTKLMPDRSKLHPSPLGLRSPSLDAYYQALDGTGSGFTIKR